MPIYHNHKAVCIFIPKTGCSFLHSNVFKCSQANDLTIYYGWDYKNKRAFGHATYLELKQLTSNFQGIEDYHFFAFVRNPFARLVSEYLFNIDNIHIKYEPNFNDFVKKIASTYMKDWYLGPHLRPQSDFLKDETGAITDRIQVHQFEDFSSGVDDLCQKIKLPVLKAKAKSTKVNSSQYVKNYRLYYNRESVAIVRQLYAEDFVNFEYSTDLWPKPKSKTI